MSDDDVPNLRGSSVRAWLSIIAPLGAAAAVLWGFAWQASRYPTREEFRQLESTVHSGQMDQAVMKVHVEALRDQMSDVKAQGSRIESTLNDIRRRRP